MFEYFSVVPFLVLANRFLTIFKLMFCPISDNISYAFQLPIQATTQSRNEVPVMASQPTTSAAGPWKTESIGNPDVGGTNFDNYSTTSTVRTIGVRWDKDKVRGVRLELYDGTSWKYGLYDQVDSPLTTYTFTSGEVLQTLTLRDSGFGYQSVRQILFTTSKGQFTAGQPGFDHEVNPNVEHRVLVGFFGTVNTDGFINALGFYIQRARA